MAIQDIKNDKVRAKMKLLNSFKFIVILAMKKT